MNPDFLVIGAGVAGMRAAIELAEAGTVLVVAKDSLRESSSEYAQGGIAVALSDDDEVELHEQDTLYAGDGLCDRAAVRTLVEEGPGRHPGTDRLGRGVRSRRRQGLPSRAKARTAGTAFCTRMAIPRAARSRARSITRPSSLPNVTFRSFCRDHGTAGG